MSMQDQNTDGTVTGINVTPLVDIMLVLLIVFMVTAKFVSDSGIKVNLPKAATTEGSVTPSLMVSVDENGGIYLLENSVDLNGLKSNLAREAKINLAVRVTLAADQSLPYREVVAVLDAIKQAGVKHVALSAEK